MSKCDVPDDRKKEYDDLVDVLMAEISKTGNDVKVNEAEEYGYEQADIEDENVMLKDMKFAISKIGEIANRVQDLINFVNPYCQSFNEDKNMKFKKINETVKMNDDEVREFVKSIGFLPDSDGIDYETQLVDALTGKDTSYNAGWGAVYYNSDKVLPYLKKYGMLGSRGIKQKDAISKLRRLFKSGKWKSPQQDELFNEYKNMKFKKINENGGEFVPPELFECDGVEYKIEPEKNPTFPEGDYAILEWENGEYKYKCRHMGAYDVKMWMNNMRKDENGLPKANSLGLITSWLTNGLNYELQAGALYSRAIKNLYVAGRCISVFNDEMWDITRGIPACTVTGEASGYLAANFIDNSQIDIDKAQKELKSRGVKIHLSELGL